MLWMLSAPTDGQEPLLLPKVDSFALYMLVIWSNVEMPSSILPSLQWYVESQVTKLSSQNPKVKKKNHQKMKVWMVKQKQMNET